MEAILNLESLFHRSKDRIKNLGEVFTPEEKVEEMLDLLGKKKSKIWSDDEISFFEPCCGHGNIVLSIFKRRLEGFYKKSLKTYGKQAGLFAVANSINTLWAIDIDSENVLSCRSRLLYECVRFLRDKMNYKNTKILVEENDDFFIHLVSAIKWHVEINESLSSLSDDLGALASASVTRSGEKWLKENGHKPMNFELSWVDFYNECETSHLEPLEYEKSARTIDKIIKRKGKISSEFDFAKVLLLED
jgi:hypothetical protein